MARLSEEQINEIRAKADIVDIISRYLPLERKGKNYIGTCPFHDDHSPSMSVSPSLQIFKCFVCGSGGNVFMFVSKYENISFIEAVYKVAEYIGYHIELPLSLPIHAKDPAKQRLYDACKQAINYTHYQLDSVDAVDVKKYLTSREIDDSLIRKFELGYNPSHDALYRFMHAKKFKDQELIDAGLCRMTSMGIKDVFSGRIMIPIHNEYGDPVAFTARRILNNDDAKYINTQETLIYTKGNLIFNYHRAKTQARKLKKAILVEGAMDVISLEKIGLTNAVATLGTACSKEQLILLKQLNTTIVVCYDGDQAGQRATYKFGKLASSMGIPFEIVENTHGLDPDEIIETYGKAELQKMIQHTLSWIDFLFNFLVNEYNLQNYSQRKEFAIEISEEIAKFSDDFEKESYFIRLQTLTGFDMRVQKLAYKSEKNQKQEHIQRNYLTYPKSGRVHAEYQILSQMLKGIRASNHYKEELGFLQDDNCNKLALYIIDYYRSHVDMDVANLLDIIKEEDVKQLLIDVSSWNLALETVNLEVLKEAIMKVKLCLYDDQIQTLNIKISQLQDPIQKAKLAKEKNELIKKKQEQLMAGRMVS